MLVKATGALASLDADCLQEVHAHLQAILDSGARLMSTAEITARMRVFAGLLRASGENLTVLERIQEGPTWVR